MATLNSIHQNKKIKKGHVAFLFFAFCFFFQQSFALLNGIKTIPGDYASVASAVADLNTQGVGTGGVVFEIGAGISYSETIPSGGLSLGSATLNPTLSSTQPIVFKRAASSLGNPLLIAYTGGTGTPATATQDDIWRFSGTDYVTIDGIDLTDPNTTNPSAMEHGYAFYKLNAGDGCSHNTITNCNITLNRINTVGGTAPMMDGSIGILTVNATASAATTALVPLNESGTNSYNSFYHNTIQNCHNAICLSGYASSTLTATSDVGNDIGGTSAATGNTLINFGGGALISGWRTAAAIQTINQYNYNYSYNTIHNNTGSGVNHLYILVGIKNSGGTGSSGTISNNTITLKMGANTLIASGYGAITVTSAIDPAVNSTLTVEYNKIKDCTWTTAVSASLFEGINLSGASNIYVHHNSLDNIIFSGNLSCNGIRASTANIIAANYNSINNYNIAVSPASVGYFYGINLSSANNTATFNTINSVEVKGTVIGMQGGGGVVNFSNNTLQNLKSTVNGVFAIYTLSSSTIQTFNYNEISNIVLQSGLTGSIVVGGIYPFASLTAAYPMTISGNSIHNLTSNMGPVYCINAYNTPIVTKNKIYDITTNGTTSFIGFLHGIYLGGMYPGSSAIISNNYIGNLSAPFATDAGLGYCIEGINLAYVGATTNLNVYYNTVYLNATSSGANFSTAALIHGAGTPASTGMLDLRNNILINTSTAKGTGVTSAFRRTASGFTNFATSSNNNLFYAGAIPSASAAIFYDGTTAQPTLSSYQSLTSPRENLSVSEFPPFLSAVGSSTSFLHINPSVPTLIANAALPIASITDDFDGNSRNAVTPDIGADELISIVFPVKLLSFYGENEKNTNHLHWITATEVNNDYFEIERSETATGFKKIGTTDGHGNSSQSINYSFDDNDFNPGINYYRLRQVDFNGAYEYSNVIAIKNKETQTNCITATEFQSNIYTLLCNQLKDADIKVFDVRGKMLSTTHTGYNSNKVDIDLTNYAKGVYFVQVYEAGNATSFKLLNK